MDREWTTAFYKEPVSGSVALGSEGLEGDGQADRRVHGGPDKAVNVYPQEHFAAWRAELGLECQGGAFGENFTTAGLTEAAVCIGDTFRLGAVVVQISQPRQPCWKLARRWRLKDLAHRVEQTGRTGWYFRVLSPGQVAAPSDVVLVDRPHPEWTVAAANRVMHHDKTNRDAARALAACRALSESWKHSLLGRATFPTTTPAPARLTPPD